MKKTLFRALCLLLSIKCTAQDQNASLLWKIEKKGIPDSYLFGTIHMICKDQFFWTKPMEKAFSKSDKICFEMDLDDQSVMMKVSMGVMNENGKTLADYFSEEDFLLLRKYFADTLHANLDNYQMMKPFMLSTLMSMGASDCGTTTAYEEYLKDKAVATKKEILGMETAEEQLAIFNKLPADSVVKEIMAIVKGETPETDELKKMMSLYTQQDIQQLHQLIKESESLAEYKSDFLDDRNEKWISRIENMMKNQSVFFAVGAGHLAGEKGVIGLLRKQGYTLTPVR